MASHRSLIHFGARREGPLDLVRRFAAGNGLDFESVDDAEDVQDHINRSFPACVVLDASDDSEAVISLCRALKLDAFTAIVPVVILAPDSSEELPALSLEAGADEVLRDSVSEREQMLRMGLLLRRAARDVSVHPSTRLPGTVQIERDLLDRMETGQIFAVCYADLDHFKEFNDRYGYNSGDKVILLTSKILRDVVRGTSPGGFIGHIGGDDFIFNVPIEYLEDSCDEIVTLFDELIPYQYTEEDRKAGYFLGKDRRGSVHRVPLMSLSIGVVTNQFLPFSHPAQISEFAAEMKSYAKSLPGTKYVVDRRHRAGMDAPGARPEDAERDTAQLESQTREARSAPA